MHVWDSNLVEDIYRFKTQGCSRYFEFENGAPPQIPLAAVMGMNEGLVADGFIQQADTVEELAEKLDIPADAFAATVARYNELYDQQLDEDFGKEAYRLSALRTPPFFGVRQTGYLLCTLDGIKIDEQMHALDESGQTIPGCSWQAWTAAGTTRTPIRAIPAATAAAATAPSAA